MSPDASPANGISRVVFVLVFVFFVFSAIGQLGIPALTGFMNQVLAYLPNVIAASPSSWSPPSSPVPREAQPAS